MKKCFALLIIAMTTLGGCAEIAYGVLQDKARDNCRKLGEPDRSLCIKRNQTDYETYRKETYDKAR